MTMTYEVDEGLFTKAITLLPAPPTHDVHGFEDGTGFLSNMIVPEELMVFLQCHSYNEYLTFGYVGFNPVAILEEENLDPLLERCIASNLLILGAGPNGDLVVCDLETLTMGLVASAELLGDSDRAVRSVHIDSGLTIGQFYLAAVTDQDNFPYDYYVAQADGAFDSYRTISV